MDSRDLWGYYGSHTKVFLTNAQLQLELGPVGLDQGARCWWGRWQPNLWRRVCEAALYAHARYKIQDTHILACQGCTFPQKGLQKLKKFRHRFANAVSRKWMQMAKGEEIRFLPMISWLLQKKALDNQCVKINVFSLFSCYFHRFLCT